MCPSSIDLRESKSALHLLIIDDRLSKRKRKVTFLLETARAQEVTRKKMAPMK